MKNNLTYSLRSLLLNNLAFFLFSPIAIILLVLITFGHEINDTLLSNNSSIKLYETKGLFEVAKVVETLPFFVVTVLRISVYTVIIIFIIWSLVYAFSLYTNLKNRKLKPLAHLTELLILAFAFKFIIIPNHPILYHVLGWSIFSLLALLFLVYVAHYLSNKTTNEKK